MDYKVYNIGIDARFYGPIGKGLGRYTQEIVDNIINIDKDNHYTIFLGPNNFDEFIVPRGEENRIKKVLVNIRWYTIKEQLLFPYYIAKEKLDLMHFTHFNVPLMTPVKFVVTIHDLILTKFPTLRATTLHPLFYRFKNWSYKKVIWQALRRAKKIITVSEFTRQDIVSQFNIKEDKIEVTYEGVANLAKGNDSLFVKKLDDSKIVPDKITQKFLLYIGNAYPHKNLERFVRVFKKLWEEDPQLHLVLVGKEDYFYKRLKEFSKDLEIYNENGDSPVFFAGYLPDLELEYLFKKALAYIFPSLYEGFGLPPLEAMAKGCPVVSSDRSSMPEVLGPAAVYFNPENETDMALKIKELINSPVEREKHIALGLKQVKKYNWWECAYKTSLVYQKILYGQKEN